MTQIRSLSRRQVIEPVLYMPGEAAPLERPDLVGAVKRIGVLARLPEEVSTAIVERAHLAEYPPHTVTFAGEDSAHAAIAVSGLQRVYLSANDGRQMTIRYVRPGELLGAIRLPSKQASIATQTLEQAAVLHLSPVQLELLALQHPTLALALADEYAERLAQAYKILALRAFSPVIGRVARDIIERALSTGALERGTHVKVSIQDLAHAVGSVREVVARSIQDLSGEGAIVRTKDGLTVLDVDLLREEADA